jgi:hypothetical protein
MSLFYSRANCVAKRRSAMKNVETLLALEAVRMLFIQIPFT